MANKVGLSAVMWLQVAGLLMLLSVMNFKEYNVLITREVTHEINDKYLRNFNASVRRTDRKSSYKAYIQFFAVYPMNNNVTVHISILERHNNEYKQGAFNLKFGFCDWMNKDILVMGILKRFVKVPSELKCPFIGQLLIEDLVVRPEFMPSFVPFGDIRIDFHFTKTGTEETILHTSAYVSVTEKMSQKKIRKT